MKVEKVELELKLQGEIMSLEDAKYAMFEEGVNEVVAQVKHFNTNIPINFTLVKKQKKLDEILRQ